MFEELAQFQMLSVMVLATAITLLAGFVKGAVGFAMPMILISGLSSIMAPEAALAGLILPTLATNTWQALRQGPRAAVQSALAHKRYLGVFLVMILIMAQFVTILPTSVLLMVLGVPIICFAVAQLIGWRPRFEDRNRGKVEVAVGAFSGSVGGLSGVWGPPTVLYLTALDTPKVEQVRVQGVIYSLGAIMLTLAHIKSGVLNAESVQLSVYLLIPALGGMLVGFNVQDRLNQALFRKATLVVLVLAGLNLIRRALMG